MLASIDDTQYIVQDIISARLKITLIIFKVTRGHRRCRCSTEHAFLL